MKRITMNRNLLIIIFSLMGFGFPCFAQGDLLIAPTRVVFEGNKQKESLNLVNIGKDTAIYSISFLQYNMKEDGSFAIIEKPDEGQMFADPFLRIFPRKIVLAPGEPQVIMLQYRRNVAMTPGELRSHLYFRAEKNNMPLGQKPSSDTTKLSVQLIPVYGISIPVIIRVGPGSFNSTLSDLKLETQNAQPDVLKFTINRTGNISVYGDILIDFIPAQGKPYQAGALRGIGVYTNINRRNVVIRLDNTIIKPLTKGKLKVQYVSNGDAKKVIYAESELEIKK